MVKYKVRQTACSLCQQDKLCDTVVFCAREKTDKKLTPFRALAKWTDERENALGSYYPYRARLHVCPDCARAKGTAPKGLWITWAVSWAALIAGMILIGIIGQNSFLPLVPAAAGAWCMMFSALFLITKSDLGTGLSILASFLSFTPLGLIILPLLSSSINRNERTVTSLTPRARELIQAQGNGTILDKYREGLRYLDTCGTLDESRLRQFNSIIGSRFSEADIQSYINSAPMYTDGMNSIRTELRRITVEAIETFENLQVQGVDLSKL